ncbi:MAG: hypothetical protein QNI99_06375 [Woeseiaceae bacterium]|nr:hypothetical protein [Woeseiaceae bacterium]
MRLLRPRNLLLFPVVAFALFYAAVAVYVVVSDEEIPVLAADPAPYQTVAIFGASGTAGDGILKAALADPGIERIHVITRRATPRIEEGVESGKVEMTIHMDYLDYAAVHEQIAEADAIYWAIGTSTFNVDDETYGIIHVDFPVQFVREWTSVSDKDDISFHYISSSDISEDAGAHWAREKWRAEQELFRFAEGTALRVIAYRPDYIGPTEEEAHLGQDLVFWFFRPVGASVRALEIGHTMLEVTARGGEFENGDRVGTFRIQRMSDAYVRRQQSAQ